MSTQATTVPQVATAPSDAPPGPPKSYAELFADAANDPYGGEYAAILGAFATTLQPLPDGSADTLANKAFAKAETEL